MYNDYDGIQHDYTCKQGLVWQQVFLPDMAPVEWADREVLWNAVEENEKTKDSRLAREFVVALPVELSKDEQIVLLTDFIQKQFVADGMCADVAIHNTDDHNPHAHIMLTIRPLTADGKWQHKTEKEYLCVRNGEERGFTAAEFKTVQSEGWEKQYQYRVGKKKIYMPPSEAEKNGYTRASKYPKSTKYGRQNPITERWNREEQLLLWREAWADAVNESLQHAGIDECIDHRSHAERDLDEQPTIHEGVTARQMERQGFIMERCEINRQIREDNALLHELKKQVEKLTKTIKHAIPAIAESMETIRSNMIVFAYQLLYARDRIKHIGGHIGASQPLLKKYDKLVQQAKSKNKERKAIVAEKKNTPALSVLKHMELSKRITELTEDLEELQSEMKSILRSLNCGDNKEVSALKIKVTEMETSRKKLGQQAERYTAELNEALERHKELQEQAAELDLDELNQARLAMRPDKEESAVARVRSSYGDKYRPQMMDDSRKRVSQMLGEKNARQSVLDELKRIERENEEISQHKKIKHEYER